MLPVKKLSKEEWKKRHQEIIEHKHELHSAIGRLEQYGKDDTTEYDELNKQLELTEWAIGAALAEAEAAE